MKEVLAPHKDFCDMLPTLVAVNPMHALEPDHDDVPYRIDDPRTIEGLEYFQEVTGAQPSCSTSRRAAKSLVRATDRMHFPTRLRVTHEHQDPGILRQYPQRLL
ncbi:hypothetical protein [Burkholderia sp. F1]|uniref:hypothetical protein n=1 Tax=Burkholderia sp. F1 TaxID=3366817 RepID=UPI003D721D3F